ncbi:MAG: signal recognition particle subunit SRP19/SEC65 family protein [Candidatus Nitrosocaldaceae archaeon]
MKDYEHIIIWLDYFDKNSSRKQGRRVSKELSVFEPKIEELINAAKNLGYKEITNNTNARYPKRWYERSAYIMIEKDDNKELIIRELAKEIKKMRK